MQQGGAIVGTLGLLRLVRMLSRETRCKETGCCPTNQNVCDARKRPHAFAPQSAGDSPRSLSATMLLYHHPFSSYSQKALIALYHYGLPFERRVIEGPETPAFQEWARMWPVKRFPVLVDGDRT